MQTSPPPGTLLANEYRLDALLGEGAFGVVYRATRMSRGDQVALKVVPLAGLEAVGGVARVRREAELAARLTHPNAVRVLASGDDPSGFFYIALELLEGRTVEDALAESGPMSPRQAALVSIDVLAALAEAHGIGVVHRDLKPANLFLIRSAEGERVKVLDFGLAKSLNPGTLVGLTRQGLTVGTPLYMPPEQILGEDISAATDVFALGLVLVELVLGGAAFEPTEPLKLLTDRISGVRPPMPAALVDTGLHEIALRATELDPRRRFPDALAMREALLRILPSLSPITVRDRTRQRLENDPTTARTLGLQARPPATDVAPAPMPAEREQAASRGVARRLMMVLGAAGLAGAIGAAVFYGYGATRGDPGVATASSRTRQVAPTAALSSQHALSTGSAPSPARTAEPPFGYAPRLPAILTARLPRATIFQLTLTERSAELVAGESGAFALYSLSANGDLGPAIPIEATPGRRPIPLARAAFAEVPRMVADARSRHPDLEVRAVQIFGEWIDEGRPAFHVLLGSHTLEYDLGGAFVRALE